MATGVDFFLNRIVIEHSMAWIPTALFALYGIAVLYPSTMALGEIYPGVTFDSVTSWLMAIGAIAVVPLVYFIYYGL